MVVEDVISDPGQTALLQLPSSPFSMASSEEDYFSHREALPSSDDLSLIPDSQEDDETQEQKMNRKVLTLSPSRINMKKLKYRPLPEKFKRIFPFPGSPTPTHKAFSQDIVINKAAFYSGLRRLESGNRASSSLPGRSPKWSAVRKISSRSTRVTKKRVQAIGVNRGVGHGIKKPKKKKVLPLSSKKKVLPLSPKQKVHPVSPAQKDSTPMKPKETSASSILKDSIKTISGIKKGSLSVTDQTKVSYEIKGGQMVFKKYRSPPPSSLTTQRSPRKSDEPKRSATKLFSPSSNFMCPSPTKQRKTLRSLSPVKFEKNDEDGEQGGFEINSLIDNLGEEINECDKSIYVTEEELKNIACEAEEQIRSLNLFENVENDRDILFQNVTDILSTIPSTLSGVNRQNSEYIEETKESNNVFPIFDKNTANSGIIQPTEGKVKSSMSKKKFIADKDDCGLTQTIIDAGQKRIGTEYCLSCSTIYTIGDPEDERSHRMIHEGFMDVIKFNGCKTERVVRHLPEIGRRIIMVDLSSKNCKYWERSKVLSVLSVVDKAIGSETNIDKMDCPLAFMYIADKMVVGIILSERISKAYPMNEGGTTCDTEKVLPVKCGISRIWVMPDYQRQGVATKLIDTLRENFSGVSGAYYLKVNELAFSPTTPNGTDFASYYTKTKRFLTYIPDNA